MPQAARLHDPIDHTRALGGLIAGAVIGGLAVTAIVLTAPVSVPAIIGGAAVAGGAAIAGGAVLGAGLGELVGGLSFAHYTAGQVAQPGAADVRINGRRAARAHLDTVDCERHPARPVIAQGSGTVAINGWPAARKGDRTACDAVIEAGSQNVIIGGPTVATDDISPEVSPLIHHVMLGVGLASAAILVGPAAALLGLAGSVVGGDLVHAVAARAFGDGSDADKILTFAGAVAGGGLAGKGGAWLDKNYQVQSTGLGMNGGNIRITPRPPTSTAPDAAAGGGAPAQGPASPYANLTDSPSVGPGKAFTASQKAKIYQQNMDANGGVLTSDLDGQPLVAPSKSVSGVSPDANEAQVDHIVPRNPSDPTTAPGSNSFGNANVLSRAQNRAKSNN